MDTALARFESARLLSLGYLARTCLWRKAWTICESQRSSECYHRQMARCRWPDSQAILQRKGVYSCGKAEWRTNSAHFLLISWLIRNTVTFWCSLRTTNNINDEPLANIVLWRAIGYYFACITANMAAFRWKFIDLFEDVCSLHTCFSADLFHLLCCITPSESSGRFFGPPSIWCHIWCYLCK